MIEDRSVPMPVKGKNRLVWEVGRRACSGFKQDRDLCGGGAWPVKRVGYRCTYS